MGKKKAVEEGVDTAETTPVVETAVAADGIIFVNREKLDRAKAIVELVSGARVPKTEEEHERKERFTAKFAEAELSPKSKEAVRFAYEILGGLVRTPGEQAEVAKKVAAMKRGQKKKAVEE